MRVISFNANGIRAAARKGFFTWLAEQDADVICVQETKAQAHQLADFEPEGYHCYYADAEKKGYSGVAIYSQQKPKKVITSMDYDFADGEGRYIQVDYKNISVISVYLPSGTSGDERQSLKYDMLDVFLDHLLSLKRKKRPFIICGDWNIAHQNIDIKNWRNNQKNSGFLPEERAWLDVVFKEHGFIDAFRHKYPEKTQYTWWSNRANAWANNVGWRIDYQVTTPCLKDAIIELEVYRDEKFSDHAPLIADYELEIT